MKKRILIFLLAFSFLFSQTVSAVVPLFVVGANIIGAGLRTPAGQDIAIGGLIGVGLIVAQLNWTRNGTDGSSKKDVLYYTNTPRPPSAAEAAEGFTAGYPSLTPPATKTASTQWKPSDNIGSFSSGDAAARDYIARIYTQWNVVTTNVSTVNPAFWIANIRANNNPGLLQSITAANSSLACPAGYTAAGGNNCNLSSAPAVARPVDGFCPINRSGATYAVDGTDPDCLNGAPPTFSPDGTFSIASADGKTFSSAPTGVPNQRKITYSYPDASKNTTHIRDIIIDQPVAVTDAPTVTGTNDREVQGTGSGTTTTPASPSTTVNVDVSPVVAAIQAAEAARAAEAAARQAAEQAAAAAIPALPANPATVPGLNLPSTTNPYDSTPPAPLIGLKIPAATGCTTLSSTLPYMGTLNIDPCNVVTAVRPMVNYLVIILGVLGGVLAWIRKDGESA